MVHVIDDDESLRSAISSLLRSIGIGSLCYGSCGEFLRSLLPDRPSCLLLDVRLPGIGGLEFQGEMKAKGIGMPVIMMTGHGDIPMSVRAMKAGAVDFLTKPFRDQDLLEAVGTAIERDVQRRNALGQLAQLKARHDSLSDRERQVMSLVTAGRLNKQVAFDLGLSEITVKLYRGSAMKKMEARTFAELVRMAERLNLRSAL